MTTQLAIFLFVTLRLFCCNPDPCSQKQAEQAPHIEDHGYIVANLPENHAVAIIGSEMISQFVIRTDLTQGELEQAKQTPLFRLVEQDGRQQHRIISNEEVKRLNGTCLYLRSTASVLNDPNGESQPLIQIHNGIYFIVETKGMVAKILLPVKGGYSAYYVPKHHFTSDTQYAQDFDRTAGCLDTMTPEKCHSCWPYEHHRPIYLP